MRRGHRAGGKVNAWRRQSSGACLPSKVVVKPTQAMTSNYVDYNVHTVCASSDKRCGLRVAPHHSAKDPSEVERGDKVGARQGAPPSILKHGRWGREMPQIHQMMSWRRLAHHGPSAAPRQMSGFKFQGMTEGVIWYVLFARHWLHTVQNDDVSNMPTQPAQVLGRRL